MTTDETTIAKLEELLAAIRGYSDPRRATTEWKQVYRLLQKCDMAPGRVTAVVGMRDVTGLEGMLDQLRAPVSGEPVDIPDEKTCREAMQAFRRRLSLTVLDEESKLGRGPLSKGGGAVAAIVPPTEWPDSVWQELIRQGRIRPIGHGLYELGKP